MSSAKNWSTASDFGMDLGWERMVVLELASEYQHILWTHGVHISEIPIRLYDSEARWGEFDPIEQTIFIARRLVREYAWHHVVGILHHEMAHQLVNQEFGRWENLKPHGDDFKRACQRLGVPDFYRRSGIDLQTEVLDWRSEKRDEEAERLLEKVRKLLALATSQNEHEALLAMTRVREIYAKYNLEQIEKDKQNKFVHLVISTGKKRSEAWVGRILSILIKHFFVRVVTISQFDAARRETYVAFEIIGTRENALMAEYVYHFLKQSVEFLVASAHRESRRAQTRFHKNSFRLGIVVGFDKKLAQTSESEKRGMMPNDPESVASQSMAHQSVAHQSVAPTAQGNDLVTRALAKVEQDRHFKEYFENVFPRLSRARSTSTRVDRDDFSAGVSAGSSLTLNKPISNSESGSASRGRMLTGH